MSAFLFVDGIEPRHRKRSDAMKELPFHPADTDDDVRRTARLWLADWRRVFGAYVVVVRGDVDVDAFLDWNIDRDNLPDGVTVIRLTNDQENDR